MGDGLSYKKAGVDIDSADAAKRAMAESMDTDDPRVLNRLGPFASLFDARFPGYEHPVLVLKMEEPGSKQKLALAHGRVDSICRDLIGHLINDIIVMGARPLAVQDCVICGRLEPGVVTALVSGMAQACREQGCTLVGGETSEQPGVLAAGSYVLTASVVGVVEKSKIIDGSRIAGGDVVLAVASNGLHTNGYSLVRALIQQDPALLEAEAAGERFLDAILRPHKCYRHAFEALFDMPGVHGMAHITGGGIQGNLNRVMPDGLSAVIDLGGVRVLPVFARIRDAAGATDADMLRTFNMGVGMAIVTSPEAAADVRTHLAAQGSECYPIGAVEQGDEPVTLTGHVRW